MIDWLKAGVEKIISRIFGTKSERDLKRIKPMVVQINQEFEKLRDLPDETLQAKTEEFRHRLAEGATVDDLLPEAFAVVKEACRRAVGRTWVVVGQKQDWIMVPFDVQLMGAIVLHQGRISEMATGEGKTLVAIFPLYLNALSGKGAHLVTVNDYLARRDSSWVGEILIWLGMTIGTIQQGMDNEERREAYGCDITYGTNNEFGFDYLRDNMVVRLQDKVQRPHHYCIVDEVDSVLIDEARTPLIISGPVAQAKQHFDRLRPGVESMVRTQNILMTRFLDEAEELLGSENDDDRYRGVTRLLQIRKGSPKNKRFMKLISEGDLKKRILQVENDYMRDKKAHTLDEDLYFSIDEKGHSVSLSDRGRELLSPNDDKAFVLPDLSEELGRIDQDSSLSPKERIAQKESVHLKYAEKSEELGNVQQLLRAFALYERDKEYVVQEGKVLIVDEFTGRLMPGRRFSEGLHQALEAKERVKVGDENQTLATITIQNYFRMYKKLAGMTGTAETEAGEFWTIYRLDVVVVPTNIPIARNDDDDLIYRTRKEKYTAIIDEIDEMHRVGRPVLVGTISVDVSETMSRMLKRRGINHNVLNAKYHQQEAEIITRAGERGAVTIATNMAGRGTDIKLGEGVLTGEVRIDPESGVKDKSDLRGGLHIVGTERHESRRIDRQLRGRAGRQGDPGSSRFFLSLEDDLMRLFAPDRIAGLMERLGEEGEVITHPFVTKAIGRAQKRVEGHNFSIREHLLKYDDVMNQQREVIYTLRDQMLSESDVKEMIFGLLEVQVLAIFDRHIDPSAHKDIWDLRGLGDEMQALLLAPLPIGDDPSGLEFDTLKEICLETAKEAFQRREDLFGPERMREVERRIYLSVIDEKWRDHLYEIDQLRGGIGLRAYGQRDPLLEYKSEAFQMFEQLMGEIETDTVRYLLRVMPAPAPGAPTRTPAGRQPALVGANAPAEPRGGGAVQTQHAATSAFQGGGGGPQPTAAPSAVKQKTLTRKQPKIGRNEPCPCGSGKKYKKCCGINAE